MAGFFLSGLFFDVLHSVAGTRSSIVSSRAELQNAGLFFDLFEFSVYSEERLGFSSQLSAFFYLFILASCRPFFGYVDGWIIMLNAALLGQFLLLLDVRSQCGAEVMTDYQKKGCREE